MRRSLLNFEIVNTNNATKFKGIFSRMDPCVCSNISEYKHLSKHLIKDIVKNSHKKEYLIASNNKKEIIALVIIEDSDFDSNIFDIKTAKIHYYISLKSHLCSKELLYSLSKDLIKKTLNYCKFTGIKYILCRTELKDLFMIHNLESFGFRLLDVLVKFRLDKVDLDKFYYSGKTSKFIIRQYQKKDLPYLQKICSNSFIYDRFHADPILPKTKCDLLHRLWIKNICFDNKSKVFVALDRNKPVGFISIKQDKLSKKTIGLNIFSIPLFAVDANFRHEGIGRALIIYILNYIKNKADICGVGTQINNIAAYRLYELLGFKIFSSYLTHRKYVD